VTGDRRRATAAAPALVAAALLALAACGAAVAPVVAPPVPVLPTPTPPPARTAPPPRPTPRATPAKSARQDSRHLLPDRDLRVLVAEGPEIVLPDPGRRYACTSAGGSRTMRGPLVARQGSLRLGSQVGAFADPTNAERHARELRSHGLDAHVVPVSRDLYRVIATGRDGETGEALGRRLTAAGIGSFARPVPTGGSLTLVGEGGATLSAASVSVAPMDDDPVRFGDRRYRGSFLVSPAAGGVRLVNVVPLETYLRGVVPAEMGPRAFPALEALKAQAVAARTYAVAHLGERSSEGYDICATQACQVYEGVGVEHPLSDRAVAETAGEILVFQGRPIDAMYHSTCAGHTEDAAAVLPERAAPYLLGVPCLGEIRLNLGSGSPGSWLGPLHRLVLVAEVVGRRLDLAGVDAGSLTTALTGREPGPGGTGLVAAFALEDAVSLLHDPGTDDEEATLRLLSTFRCPLGPRLEGEREGDWLLALALRLAQLAGHVEEVEGRLVPSPAGPRLVVDRGEQHRELAGDEVVLERRGAAWRQGGTVAPAGSRATLWCVRGHGCVALEVEPRREADDRSAWGWWVRELSLAEVGERLAVRGVSDLAVQGRGTSGRVAAMSVTGSAGAVEVGGYRFRMALGLPDTLFTVAVRNDVDQGPTARFVGRGWGHGIGMCQNGAFGLAQGGADYEQILSTYYTGVALAAADPSPGGTHE